MKLRLVILAVLLSVPVSMFGAGRPGWVKYELRDGRSPAAERVPHELLQTVGGEKIRDYESFSVIRVPTHRRDAVAEAAKARGLRAVEHEEWDIVRMPNAAVDTRTPQLPSTGVIRAYEKGRGLYVVQFAGPLGDEESTKIASVGIKYLVYVPYNAMLVAATEQQIQQLSTDPAVQWTSIYHPAFRARPADLAMFAPAEDYIVQVANVPGNDAVIDRVRAASLREPAKIEFGSLANYYVRISSADAYRMLEEPYVIALEKQPTMQLSGEREAISVTGGAALYPNEPYQNGTRPFKTGNVDYRTWLANRGVLDTSGFRIAVTDTGLDGNDWTLRPNHLDIGRTNMVWQSYVAGEPAGDGVGHGTLVAGLALGNPTSNPPANMTSQTDAGGFLLGMGIAPKTGIFAQKIVSNAGNFVNPIDIFTYANDANSWQAAVQTHSYNNYNAADAGAYTTQAQTYDAAVRDTSLGDGIDHPMPMTISAGNICQASNDCTTTMVLSPASAKNVISVGGVESYRPSQFTSCSVGTVPRRTEDFQADSFMNVAWRSRRGTTDGRIKPEILAPMNQISSTRTQYVHPGTLQHRGWFCNPTADGFYSYDSGTSFAAPQVAGAAVLLDKQQNTRLSPPMLKAALVANSISVKGGLDRRTSGTVAARPNSVQGYGRLNLNEALSNTVVETYLDESSWTPFTAAGQNRRRFFTVANSAKPVVIVLAWSDEPANVSANPTLVRDLDLEIWDAEYCRAYSGNQLLMSETSRLFGGLHCATPTYDRRNNVEMIVIPAGVRTSFWVDIWSVTWGFGGHNQKFALYVSNAY